MIDIRSCIIMNPMFVLDFTERAIKCSTSSKSKFPSVFIL